MGKKRRKKKTKVGRPPKPPGEKYGEIICLKVTRAEKAMLKREARKRGISLGALLMSRWRKPKKGGT